MLLVRKEANKEEIKSVDSQPSKESIGLASVAPCSTILGANQFAEIKAFS